MMKPEEANTQLKQWRVSDEEKTDGALGRLVQPIKKLPKKLSELTFGVLGFNGKGEPFRSRWQRTPEENKLVEEAMVAFENLPAGERKKIFAIVAPRLTDELEAAWNFQKTTPYQMGYGRRAFRAPDNPELSLETRIKWFENLATTLNQFKEEALTLPWLAQWTPHAFPYLANRIAPILAASIDSGTAKGEEVFDILCRTITREDPIGMMGDHVIKSLFLSSRKEGWELLEKTLLAAQRQEGLRQSILNQVDLAHPEAFARVLRLILEQDLVRFSSVARCINVWFNLLWDSSSVKVLNENIEQFSKILESESERKKALSGSHPENIYRALWASAFINAPKTVPIATQLLKYKSDEIRFVAVWGLTTMGLQSAADAKLALIDDPNLQIALTAALSSKGIVTTNDSAGILMDNNPDHHQLFDGLERLYLRIPEKPTVLKPIVWPWTERSIDRSMLIGNLLNALKELPPTRILPYLPHMSPYERKLVVGYLAQQKKWDGLTRTTLLDLAGDASSDVRGAAIGALETNSLRPEEMKKVEGYLTRKTDDLRRGLVKLLLKEKDELVIESADRLMESKEINQRLAGLELIRQMAETKRSFPECQKRAEDYRTHRKKLNREEATQIQGILASQKAVATLDDALGFMNPKNRSPVVPPRKMKVLLISPAAIECMKSLDQLVHENREIQIIEKHYNGDRLALLGTAEGYYLPSLDLDKPIGPQKAKLPLIEVWEKWASKRDGKLKDNDGLELLRAAFAINFFDRYDFDTIQKEAKPYGGNKILAALFGICAPPSLKYPGHVDQILTWLLDLNPPKGSVDFVIDCIEHSFSQVPKEAHQILLEPPKQRSYYEPDPDWRDMKMFNMWDSFLGRVLKRAGNDYSTDQLKRYWNLLHYYDEPIPGANRQRPSFGLTCQAVQSGFANQDDLADQLLGPRNPSRYGNPFGELHSLFLHEEKWEKTIQNTPGLVELRKKIPERILEIELSRGESPTAATLPALALGYLRGTPVLFRILEALAKAKLKKGSSWRDDSETSRAVTLTSLLKITYPAESDTQEDFNKGMREAISAGYCTEQRALELAFLAPQWTKVVEGFLNWRGFSEGIYWFMAHMDSGWGYHGGHVAAEAAGHKDDPEEVKSSEAENTDPEDETSDSNDSNRKTKPKKLSAWERLLLERTPLTDEERNEGAVDVAWFRRTWAELGEDRWKQMAEAARFAANAQQANKAKFLADVLLGNTSRQDLMDGIQKRKLKEHVRLLGLLPLGSGAKRDADLRERYEVMQDYRKYARGLSSLTKPAAMRASEIGSQNLARLAGYPDPLRLEWAMEAESVKDLAQGPVTITKEGITVTLCLNEEAQPELTITRDGKTLKAIPAPIKKKYEEISELAERSGDLRRKASRMKWSLETAMCRGDSFTGTELQQLMDHAILAPLLSRLVLIGEGIAGYPDKKGKALRDYQGKLEPVKATESIRIAHPHDLFSRGDWGKWQQECFQSERVQPFKQVFRELYPLTQQEKKDGALSQRFAGQQIHPTQAMALWGQRGWSTQDGVCKIFHDLSLVVDVSFLYGGGTAIEVEGLTLDTIQFRKRDESKPIPLSKVPPILFSETMRDLDLVVSVAHRGEVDPEASASTVEMRASLIRETCQLLGLKNVRIKEPHALIEGHFSQYSLHLGSGGVHRLPGGALCILPVHSQHRGRLFLPFADNDPRTAEIVSKILLLARDQEIQDPTILQQLGAPESFFRASEATNPTTPPSKPKKKATSSEKGKEGTPKEISTSKRRFEFAEGASNKFWEIDIDGDKVTTRWGRQGTDGQSKTKTFADSAAAKKEFDKLIKEKTEKGYQETSL